jgi:hypothetical protein
MPKQKQKEDKLKVEYVEDDELRAAVDDIINNPKIHEMEAVRELGVAILCCMIVKMSEDGEEAKVPVWPAKLNKLNEAERLYVKDHAHYILTMEYSFWHAANEKQRFAALLDTLLDIEPTKEESDANIKLKKRTPDIRVKHLATIGYYGAYNEDIINLREVFDSNTLLVDLTGQARQLPKVKPAAAKTEETVVLSRPLKKSRPAPAPEPEADEPEAEPEAEAQAEEQPKPEDDYATPEPDEERPRIRAMRMK